MRLSAADYEQAIPDPSEGRAFCVLGIDPGVTGALAWYFPADPRRITVEDIPVAGGEVDVDALAARLRQMRPDVAIIERQAAMPKQGVSSSFKLGSTYGALRAVVAALAIPQHLVTPAKWKGHYRLSADKEQARRRAIDLWPGVGCFSRKKDHGRAEAALIARFGAEVTLKEQLHAARGELLDWLGSAA